MNTHNNDLDLFELSQKLWRDKLFIIIFSFICCLASILYSLNLPNIYSSSALLKTTNSDQSLTSKLGDYSMLAGIAGVNLPNDGFSKSQEAIARIKSYDFFVSEILPNIQLEDLVAANDWNPQSNSISYDSDQYNSLQKKWVRNVGFPYEKKPSNQEAYGYYLEIFTIEELSSSNFISIELDHVSPYIAREWVDLIVKNINNYMKKIDQAIAKNSIVFLESITKSTNLSEMKDTISLLLEDQVKVLMLAEASDNYIFSYIESPYVSEKKSRPSRFFIVFFGGFLGFAFSVLISTIRHLKNNN